MQASIFAAVVLGLALASASTTPSATADRQLRRHARHVRTDKTIVAAPMQVDTKAHPRVDMPADFEGIPTNTKLPPDFAKKPH